MAERGWVDVSFSSSHRVGSRSMRCLLEVIPRCVVAGGHSPRDIRSSLSVRRAHLRKFTRSVRRMYLLWFNALRVSYRVLMGSCARRVAMTPSSRHGRAAPCRTQRPEVPASKASRAISQGQSDVPSHPLTIPYHSWEMAIGQWRRASRDRGYISHSKCSKCAAASPTPLPVAPRRASAPPNDPHVEDREK